MQQLQTLLSIIIVSGFIFSASALINNPQLWSLLVILAGVAGWYAGKRRALNQHLNQSGLTDSLTGLYNYEYFTNRLSEEKKRADRFGSRLSLALLDLDHFKRFTEQFGMRQGNELLKQISQIIQAQIRAVDIPVRYGGEEFAVLLPNTGKVAAQEVAERIRIAVQDASFSPAPITISAGVATYPLDALNELELIDKADEALSKAKESGRNKIVVYQETEEQAAGK